MKIDSFDDQMKALEQILQTLQKEFANQPIKSVQQQGAKDILVSIQLCKDLIKNLDNLIAIHVVEDAL